ncbi:unnamed protein product [Medioppia subpectinata]|uniref:BHLH domain-containing protein n=1 Tax=Medioppia subpectinata TaxID=1979941 RepID=A0A7R9Q2K3_9ACAR|nr:unnamed protein product [Medioppia subpectinata]CAG2110280.1 unnamed protein product [Medioppia subpectinata]
MSFSSIKLEPSMHLMSSNTSCSALNTSQTSAKLQPLLAKKSSPSSAMSGQMSPTASSMSSSMGSPELLRCKRRINFGGLGYAIPQTQPATVARRNERERNRVKMVNMGFATLRQHVPNGIKNKKMSKVETLRSAVDYIRELRELLGEHDHDDFTSNDTHCIDNLQVLSSDENWNPSPSVLSTSATLSSPTSMTYTCNSSAISSNALRKIPNSPSSPHMTTSPSPSMGSDASSPYDSLDSIERQVSPEEEELFDFTNWFS